MVILRVILLFMTYPRATLWESALRTLHSAPRRWSDRLIAEALCDLSDEAIRHLHRVGWNRDTIKDVLVPGSGGKDWTKSQVRHQREMLGLPANPYRRTRGVLAERAIIQDRDRVADLGWGHLLTDHPDLRGREAEILSALALRGPLSKSELVAAVGHSLRHPRRGTWTGSLFRRGLILQQLRIYCPRHTPFRFMLAPGVSPNAGRVRRRNGVDRLLERLRMQ